LSYSLKCSIGNKKSLRTCIQPTEDVRVLNLEIQPISLVYEYDKRAGLSNKIRVYGTDI